MSVKQASLRPFLKWAGGKRQLLPMIRQFVPLSFKSYFEPFVGAGAVLFDLCPTNAIINDINTDLMNAYLVIKNHVDELIDSLSEHKNDREYYYALRNIDRTPEYANWSDIERASRLIFINKTCFNGLFRTNSRGYWNVPFGRYANPTIVDVPSLKAVSRYLQESDVKILNNDFTNALIDAGKNDFVYLDPPYDPISPTSSFTAYYKSGFNRSEQERLKETIDNLTRRGCQVMLSNSNTEYVRQLYKNYNIVTLTANRTINSVASKRGKVEEVLILNYDITY